MQIYMSMGRVTASYVDGDLAMILEAIGTHLMCIRQFQ